VVEAAVDKDDGGINSFRILMALYLANNVNSFNALRQRDNHGRMIVHHAATNHQLLGLLFEQYSAEKEGYAMLVADLQQKDSIGKNVLHYAATCFSIQLIMRFYEKHPFDTLALLSEADIDGNTVLHCATANRKSFFYLLKRYPTANDCLQVLFQRNRKQETVLHPNMADFQKLLYDALLFLIAKDASLASCLCFLSTPMTTNPSSTPLNVLVKTNYGRVFLSKLIDHPSGIVKAIPIDMWFPPNSLSEAENKEFSPAYQLTKDREKREFLRLLCLVNPKLSEHFSLEICKLWGLERANLMRYIQPRHQLFSPFFSMRPPHQGGAEGRSLTQSKPT
jgi:hypothetical protein